MRYAVSYKRFSSPQQARGDSNRRQTDLAEEYCKRHNIKLIDTYLDAGLSGFTAEHLSDNGALKTLLNAARCGKFKPGTLLIVESLDRLTRQEISTAVRLFLDILDAGLVIVTLIDGEQVFTKERVDNDPTALLIAVVILLRANNESRNRRERARQFQSNARRKARERNIPITAQCPIWLTLRGKGDARHFVVDKERARIVRRIYRLSVQGLGQHRIAQLLNEEHVPTFTHRPRWRGAAVAHILVNEAVHGTIHPVSSIIENGKPVRVLDPEGPIEAYYPPIISKELYERARAAAQARQTHRPRKPREWAYTNLAARLGRCVLCGDTVCLAGPYKKNRFAYLRCVGALDKDCSNNSGFPYAVLEAMLLALDDLTTMVGRFVFHTEGGSPARRIAEAEEKIARAQRNLKRLVFTVGNLSGAAAQLAKRKIERLNRVVQEEEEKISEAELRLHHSRPANTRESFARFRAAKEQAHSPELQERYLSRAVLVAELRKLIDVVILHEHRVMSIHMKRDASGHRVVYVFDPYGIHGVHVEGCDGTMMCITTAALLAFQDTFSPRTQPPGRYARRPRKLAGLLKSIPVTKSPSGDWRTIAPKEAELPGIVARAERLMAAGAILVGKPVRRL